jgi:glucose-6-phosphate 1-dehydrogenase
MAGVAAQTCPSPRSRSPGKVQAATLGGVGVVPARKRRAPVSTESRANPLRDSRDKRLPRIAGPCGVVVSGVTDAGDLRPGQPRAIAARVSVGRFARRDWADENFAELVHDAIREHARTPFREEVWARLAEGIRFVPGSFDDRRGLRRPRVHRR